MEEKYSYGKLENPAVLLWFYCKWLVFENLPYAEKELEFHKPIK